MTVSDRQHDAFDNPAKAQCRDGNPRVLREAAHLLWEDDSRSRLRCDWCELMGATGFLTLDVLQREGVLAAGGFVGVDLDLARIDGFRQSRPDLKWIAGNSTNTSMRPRWPASASSTACARLPLTLSAKAATRNEVHSRFEHRAQMGPGRARFLDGASTS
jgi:hypothetical protein